jgi:hypothetical protein
MGPNLSVVSQTWMNGTFARSPKAIFFQTRCPSTKATVLVGDYHLKSCRQFHHGCGYVRLRVA